MQRRRFRPALAKTAKIVHAANAVVQTLEPRRMLSLTHLWTFNDGTANDSVGGANATLFNGASVVSGWLAIQNSSIALSGDATAQYASLPSGVLPASGSATVEVWYTNSSTIGNFTRVFDFGDQVSGSGNSYFFFTPKSSTTDARAVLRPAGGTERIATYSGATNNGFMHMAAVVIDSGASLLRLYVDGQAAGTAALSGAGVNSISSASAFLGKSLFDADPAFNGLIDEVRIYNDAQSAANILQHAGQGATRPVPTVLPHQIENLDRGVVAMRTSATNVYVGWRLLASDFGDTAFNLYRSADGAAATKLNSTPITKTTNFNDTTSTATAANRYFVRAVRNGVEGADSASYTLIANAPTQQYINIPLVQPPIVALPDGSTYTYSANDASVGDLDGDGKLEIILKWDPSNSHDSSQDGFTGPTYLDAYKLDGTFMWRINEGQNIRAGAHDTQFIVYDLDGDGKAEVAIRTAPGTIDGVGNPVLMGTDKVTDDYRNATTGRINTGPEYLTIFNGLTGAQLATTAYKPDRINIASWGDSYGNRGNRFLMAVAYVDGQRPSLICGRGLFPGQSGSVAVRNEITAWDYRGGSLSLRWWFRADKNTSAYGLPNVNTGYIGQGNYEMHPADVDGDGKDEIVYGSVTINDDGTGLYTTGLGHGDALHVSDFDPLHPGTEIYMPMESPGSNGHITTNVHDGATGAILFATYTTPVGSTDPDVGRGVAFDIDPRYLGAEVWDSYNPDIYNVRGADIQARGNAFYNFAIQWDSDPLYELLDGTTIADWRFTNGVGGRSNYVFGPAGLSGNNGTKNTPCLAADLFGDYREEVIWRHSDATGNSDALQIWTTTMTASQRLTTLMQDVQYREAVAWQNVGYNQPTHTSYYFGDSMPTPPVPQLYYPGVPNNTPIDITMPWVVSWAFDYTTSPNKVNIVFSEDVSASLNATDLTITRLSDNSAVVPTSVSWNAATRTATFVLPTGLADANYSASIGGVTDATGLSLNGMLQTFDFFVLKGDANHDRYVDALDQAILTANLNQSGKNFSQGDFDYNGTVNSADQAILTAQFHELLPIQGAYALTTTTGNDSHRLRRESSTLLDDFVGADATATYRIIMSAITSVSFAGGNGNDALTLEFANGTPFVGTTFTFDGGAGTSDSITIKGTSAADTAAFSSTTITLAGTTISVSNHELVTFDGLLGRDVVTANSGPTVNFATTQEFASLTIANGASASTTAGANLVIDTNTLNLNASGRLDLNNNAMIIRTVGARATIEGKIVAGQNGFDNNGLTNWNGNGIMSSAAKSANLLKGVDLFAIGVIRNGDLNTILGAGSAFTVFKGRTVGVDDVLVRYTYVGDTTFDGTITIDDYNIIDGASLGLVPKLGWVSGDFDFNGSITIDDYNAIDTGYLYQGVQI